MTTPKTTKELFDRTDWPKLRLWKMGLITAIRQAEAVNRPVVKADLESLLDFIDCLQVAAEAEGYPVFNGRVKP